MHLFRQLHGHTDSVPSAPGVLWCGMEGRWALQEHMNEHTPKRRSGGRWKENLPLRSEHQKGLGREWTYHCIDLMLSSFSQVNYVYSVVVKVFETSVEIFL